MIYLLAQRQRQRRENATTRYSDLLWTNPIQGQIWNDTIPERQIPSAYSFPFLPLDLPSIPVIHGSRYGLGDTTRNEKTKAKVKVHINELPFKIRNMNGDCCICIDSLCVDRFDFIVCKECHNGVHDNCWKKFSTHSNNSCCYCRSIYRNLIEVTTACT